jgi:hypothetical protein
MKDNKIDDAAQEPIAVTEMKAAKNQRQNREECPLGLTSGDKGCEQRYDGVESGQAARDPER